MNHNNQQQISSIVNNLGLNINYRARISAKRCLITNFNNFTRFARNINEIDYELIEDVLDTINYDEYGHIMVIMIPLQSDREQFGYKKAHFLIQRNRNEPNSNYAFIGNIEYHRNDQINYEIEYLFGHLDPIIYVLDDLIYMVEVSNIREFCLYFENFEYIQENQIRNRIRNQIRNFIPEVIQWEREPEPNING
jgi:hypothetical protein